MNKLNLKHTGGFPFETNTLDYMQDAYSLFNTLGAMAGELVILKGCEITGNSVASGVVYIKALDEVLPFKGSTLSDKVIVREDITSLPFEDGTSKDVEHTRYATFGNSPDGYLWADFKRIDPLTTVIARIAKLEWRVKHTIPIGTVAIWGKPADAIPIGWIEYEPMRGYVPVGYRPRDFDFGTLDKTLGERTHTLTTGEMPSHKHNVNGRFYLSNDDGGDPDDNPQVSFDQRGTRVGERREINDAYMNTFIESTGDNQPHNNIQPSRVVKFIQFVGFDD
jgi:hypothetical protein